MGGACLKSVCLGAVQKQHVKASERACSANGCNDGASFLWNEFGKMCVYSAQI